MKERLYPIHIACNDADSGEMGRHAEGISFSFGKLPSFDLTGASVSFRQVKRVGGACIRLSRLQYPFERMQSWVGNWCWNAYYFRPVIAAKIVQDLMRDGRWSPDGGLVDAHEAWDRKDLFAFMNIWREANWKREPIQIVGSCATKGAPE